MGRSSEKPQMQYNLSPQEELLSRNRGFPPHLGQVRGFSTIMRINQLTTAASIQTLLPRFKLGTSPLVQLNVTDDGAGFDVGQVQAPRQANWACSV
jgi:hypothetical protein